jgi:dihydropteroate synthase
MGVVNVTPDSFSDGGLYLDPGAAVAHGLALLAEGAEILDVGGESTRPGAEPVAADEELRRVLPVVVGLAGALDASTTRLAAGGGSLGDRSPRDGSPRGRSTALAESAGESGRACVSIDTSKASVARAALDAGATLVNDVTALRGDPEMAAVVAQSGAECCLMHMQGEPRTMQREPRYGDVVDDVRAFLEERLAFAVREGVTEERVLLDPGIGFGKTLEHNLQLLRRLSELTALGRPLVVGTSRKSFLGRLLADAPPAERLPGTLATCVLAYERGATVLRVHDVAPARAALLVAAATLGAR